MKRVGIQLMTFALLAMQALPAWAEMAHEGEKATLPQLNVALYPGVLFWLVLCFFSFFAIVSLIGVPGIRKVQARRKALVTTDLKAAQKASDEAQRVMDAYEEALAAARAEAQKTVTNIIQAAASEAAEEREKLSQELTHRANVAQQNIAAARDAAIKESPRLLPALVQDILGKLIPSAAVKG